MTASELGRLIQKHQLVAWPMEVDELRAAIKGPAALPDVGLTFEGSSAIFMIQVWPLLVLQW